MSGIYEKNVEALRKFQPQFDMSYYGGDAPEFEIFITESGHKDVKCVHKEALCIHGGVSPLETAKERTASINLKGDGLVVSFGLGFGYEAREIIKKMDTGTNFIIVEPCGEIMADILREEDLTDIFTAPNVYYLMFKDKQDALPFFRPFISANNYKNLAAFVISPYVDMFFAKCRDILFILDDMRATYAMSGSTVKRFTTLWQRNVILNARTNLSSRLVSDFFDKFKGLPAVIVSAGPSLSKNVAILRGLEDRCVILCVDTALKALLENGVSPHFVVSVDGQEAVAKKFDGLDYSRIPLIYVPASNSRVVNEHHGDKVLSVFQDSFYALQLNALGKNITPLEMGGSVATSAFSFAQLAGCDPIVLVGQDLAYTGMKSHVEGAAYHSDIKLTSDMLAIPSSQGGTVYTSRVLLAYITWFQTYAASDKSRRKYINATEGGALLLGFEHDTLKNTAEKYMSAPGVLNRVAEAFEAAPFLTLPEKKLICEKYKEAVSFIEEIKAPARNASKQLKLIYGLLSKSKPNYQAVNAAYSKIGSFENKMKDSREKLEILSIAIAPFAEALNEEFRNAELKSDLEKNRFAAIGYSKYYGEIADRCDEFAELLKDKLLDMI